MPVNLNHPQELHEFPVLPELKGANFVDLALSAGERIGAEAVIDDLWIERSPTLSHGDNEVFVLRTDRLPSGGFKYLSARNSAAQARDKGYDKVVSASAGSFGVGLGHADIDATVYTPVASSPGKKNAMQELGVTVIEEGQNFDEAQQAALLYAKQHEAKFLEPYASLANLAATAILGLKIAAFEPKITDLVTQFGGGSLHGGVGPVVREQLPEARLHVVQMAGCSPFVDSVLSGEIKEASDAHTRSGSYFRKLGGVGVGKVHALTLGHGSRYVDSVFTTYIDQVYATMHDYQQESGDLPEFAAAVGLEGARRLARTPGLHGARIMSIFTGGRPESYLPGYLKGMSIDRQDEEEPSNRRKAVDPRHLIC